MTLLEDTLTGN